MHEPMDVVPGDVSHHNHRYFNQRHTGDDTHSIASHDHMGDIDNKSNASLSSNRSKHIPTNGNYKGYYKFRELQHDENSNRIVGFQDSWFHDQRVLDIGCNEGDLTMLIASKFHPASVVGIDVDKRLIESAGASLKRAMYEYRMKRKKGSLTPVIPIINENDMSAQNSDRSRSSSSSSSLNGFLPRTVALSRPVSLQQPLYPGHIVTTSPTDNNNGQFPFNVAFKCEDIMDPSHNFIEDPGYGVILCMSVSKWIHLNHGDDGIMKFFHKLFSMTIPGGKVIMEYQPWKSYLNNKGATDNIKRMFKLICIRPDDFERILSNEIGFKIIDRLGTSLALAKGFQRPILILEKPLPSIAVVTWTQTKASDMLDADEIDTRTDQSQSNETATRDIYGIKRNLSHPLSIDYTSDTPSPEEMVPAKRFRVDL